MKVPSLLVQPLCLEKLALDPIIICILAPMILKSDRKSCQSSVEITRILIFIHHKLIGLIKHHLKVGPLNA
jgi:hypothetical protein